MEEFDFLTNKRKLPNSSKIVLISSSYAFFVSVFGLDEPCALSFQMRYGALARLRMNS